MLNYCIYIYILEPRFLNELEPVQIELIRDRMWWFFKWLISSSIPIPNFIPSKWATIYLVVIKIFCFEVYRDSLFGLYFVNQYFLIHVSIESFVI